MYVCVIGCVCDKPQGRPSLTHLYFSEDDDKVLEIHTHAFPVYKKEWYRSAVSIVTKITQNGPFIRLLGTCCFPDFVDLECNALPFYRIKDTNCAVYGRWHGLMLTFLPNGHCGK